MIASPNSLIIDTIKYDEINVFNYQHLSKTEPFSKTSQEIGGLKIREEGVFPTVKTIGDLF